jgi:UDP-N-acetylmuramoyl-tripeptide--D-alanyl-D-alanine ligase
MDLAAWGRGRLDADVVGITGSVGKTSTKDLVAAALAPSRRVWANERSFNNEQGLPVTILGAPDDTEVLVLEMGMRGRGEIAELCAVGRPTIGVVTVVGESHTELVGGLDGVARAKRELVEALPRTGTAVLNADDPRVVAMAGHTPADVVTFGTVGPGVDVALDELVLDELARASFAVHTPWGSGRVRLAVSGAHMATNALAAVAVAGVLGTPLDAVVDALGSATVSAMRMHVRRTASGAIVLDDVYNANPTSMRAALDALAAVQATRRVAVLGRMAELDDPDAGHRAVAAHAAELGIELIAVGTDRFGVDPSVDPLADLGAIGADDAVLFKASRVVGLERLVAELLDRS